MDTNQTKINRRFCSVPQCSNKASNGVSFHKFPVEKSARKKWVAALKIGKEVSKYMVVCSAHFRTEDFFHSGHQSKRKKLKVNSVPSCKLPVRRLDKPLSEKQQTLKNKRVARAERRSQQERTAKVLSACSESCGNPQDIIPDEMDVAEALLELHNAVGEGGLAAEKDVLDDEPEKVMFVDPACQASTYLLKPSKVTLLDMLKTEADLNAYTGVSSFKQLETICRAAELLQTVEADSKLLLDITERVVLTLVKIKLNISFVCIAVLFNISNSTCALYFQLTVSLLSTLMKEFIIWPMKEDILRNMPLCFSKFKDTRVVLDCTEIPVEKPACLKCRLSTYSHYKGTNSIKFLIGVAPEGLITFCSDAYGGRASDKAIFLQSGLMNKLEPHVDAIMSDKGFLVEHECSMNGIKLIRPPFLGKAKQFTVAQGHQTAAIAQARVHVERSIQRIKIFKLVKNNLPWNLVPYVDEIMTIVVGLVNLSAPILALDKF